MARRPKQTPQVFTDEVAGLPDVTPYKEGAVPLQLQAVGSRVMAWGALHVVIQTPYGKALLAEPLFVPARASEP